MSRTHHHPEDVLLMEFAAGVLSTGHALCIEAHLHYCETCRAAVSRLNLIGGAMVSQGAETSVPDEIFDRVLQCIAADEPAPAPAVHKPVGKPLVATLMDLPFDQLPWKRQLGGVSVYDIGASQLGCGERRVVLQKLAKGCKAPAHTHHGDEMTVVLQGAFSDETGVFLEGDFVLRDDSHTHRPLAVGNIDCISLSVLDAPVRLTGVFTRLLNPLLH